MKIETRPINSSDFDFLKEVYKSTRQHEMSRTGWNNEQINSFIEFQFNAQHAHYTNAYKGAEFNIIIFKNIQIGRLYTWETDTQIRIVDITLLPPYTREGIGTNILQKLIAKSNKSGKTLNLHVFKTNSTFKFYQQLQFKITSSKDSYYFMERTPDRIL